VAQNNKSVAQNNKSATQNKEYVALLMPLRGTSDCYRALQSNSPCRRIEQARAEQRITHQLSPTFL